MRPDAGDYLVLLGPPTIVGSAIGVVVLIDEPAAFMPLLMVLLALTMLGIAVGLMLMTRTTRGPATFHLSTRDGAPAFAVPPTFRNQCVFYGLFYAALVLMSINGFRVTGVVVLPLLSGGIAVVTVFSIALLIRRMVISGPLLLTAEGIAVDGGRSFIPWEALSTGPDVPQWRLEHPELVRGRRIKQFLPGQVVPLDVSLWFLARAIHLYLEHPEHRAAIGTDEELARLRGQLTPQIH